MVGLEGAPVLRGGDVVNRRNHVSGLQIYDIIRVSVAGGRAVQVCGGDGELTDTYRVVDFQEVIVSRYRNLHHHGAIFPERMERFFKCIQHFGFSYARVLAIEADAQSVYARVEVLRVVRNGLSRCRRITGIVTSERLQRKRAIFNRSGQRSRVIHAVEPWEYPFEAD